MFYCRFLSAISAWLLLVGCASAGDGPASTGPRTEKRFPPLQVPQGFKATLFACDPLIEYPSAIALGPSPGSLFVAVDYLTGLGTDIVRRDEIRLIEDTDGDGYADKQTVFAAGFNSIQGLAYHNGTLYVMHAPYLSALRDTKGTGKADQRRDLLTGLGLPPEKDQIRLHNANGVVVGHDGWLYLALGDRGADVVLPEGDRLILNGGGILRCRPDGRDLHVFSTGLRNIYDVALDAELNVFVRDNENDGGAYKVRVCHSFFGADHGYPYLYDERPDETLPPLADLGLGSSAGGVCYLEQQFPLEYRGNLFFCEWGRAVVRYKPERRGGSFAPLKEFDFASGRPDDSYGFKPTDLVVARDGSLYVADWGDGQRPRRGRGRIYQIRYVANTAKQQAESANGSDLAKLDAESYFIRADAQHTIERRGKEGLAMILEALDKNRLGLHGRLHAVWIMVKLEGQAATERLFALAKSDPDPRVQAQALRAIADLTDPVFMRHRLAADRGDDAVAQRIAALAPGLDARVQLEAVIALGRLRWQGAPEWLRKKVKLSEPALAHAVQMTLRRADNWPAVLKLLDEPDPEPYRTVARRALAEQRETPIVDGLINRLRRDPAAGRRREYADALARVYKQPGPWSFWGYRPGPRPANIVSWQRSEAIEQALDQALDTFDRADRPALLRQMLREKIPARLATLARWLKDEANPDSVSAILDGLGTHPGAASRPYLTTILQNRGHTSANRLQAVSLFLQGLAPDDEKVLLTTCAAVEDGPVLAALLRALGDRRSHSASAFLLGKLDSAAAVVRASALRSLAELEVREARMPVNRLLLDADAHVRAAAAMAAGKIGMCQAGDRLLQLARDPHAEVRRCSLDALRRLREPRALPIAVTALGDRETTLTALEYLAEMGGPDQVKAVTDLARAEPSVDMLTTVGKVLTQWLTREKLPRERRPGLENALAEIHGSSGILLGWHIRGPVSPAVAADLTAQIIGRKGLTTGGAESPAWRLALSTGIEARVRLGSALNTPSTWLGYCEVDVAESVAVEFFTASTGLETIWLNDRLVFQRDKPGIIGPYPDRFEATLAKGRSRILVSLTGPKETAEFRLRFRRKSAAPNHERFALAALSRAGNPEHGRQIFLNAEKSLCIKCHRVGDKGERIGPELTGLGSRFSKIYIVESILEPSRTISPSFETTSVILKNGKTMNGIKIADTGLSITLADNQAQKLVIARQDIEELERHPVSTMPEGLEKRLTEDEFVDLISYLVNLKELHGR